MDLKLTSRKAEENTVEAISSKSYVHRLLIAAALCGSDCEVETNIVSKDMEATIRALRSLGLSVSIKGSDYGAKITRSDIIDCGESGSTARFLLPVAALVADGVTLTGSGKLPERPMGPLCDVLRSAGVTVSSDHIPITVSKKPHSGNYEIPGNVSSQFISGLLFMLPLLSGDSHLKVTGGLESAAYVDMTIDVLARFCIRIEREPDGFFIPGGQNYTALSDPDQNPCHEIKAEGDWSNGAYIMALGALGCGRLFDSLTVTGLDPESIQGDRAVVDIFEKFGIQVDIIREENSKEADYVIKSSPKHPVDIDCTQIPDLVPALAVLAAFAPGKSTFRNVGRLRMKECDRVEAISEMLGAIAVKVDIKCDGDSEVIVVCGCVGGQAPHISIDSKNDHRIAMAAAAIAAATDNPVVIKDAMAVDKSYPGFYDVIRRIGIDSEET
ncbi:MAG: 3-phosphoshikimate 1-carboxyvinyltransferase [Lachnospiraceae bacterium]|nr:3-phosphoshikimate 1-carboxyvinyltransferase [Lachnospiraceae bacterium]